MRTVGISLLPLVFALGSADAAQRHAVPAAPPPPFSTSGADLRRLVAQARADYEAAEHDQFAPRTLSDAVEGQEFTLTLKPGDGQSVSAPSPNGAFYAYEDGTLRLVLTVSTSRATHGAAIDYAKVIEFAIARHATAGKVGTNAFGARVIFKTVFADTSGIARVGGIDADRFKYSAALDGPSAKALALSSRFVIHGTLARLPIGHLGDCGTNYAAATVESPTEAVILNCWIGARISSVELVGPAGLLKRWDTATSSGINVISGSAQLIGDAAYLVSADDYPPGETASGTTIARLTLGGDGRVEDCAIEKSSGSARLDEQACTLAKRRARFTASPNGASAPSIVTLPVRWEKPR